MECIEYKKGYKYQLVKQYGVQIPIKPERTIQSQYEYVTLTNTGYLIIKAGYAWDGASPPAIDTKTFMRGSLVHDALYQLMREEKLPSTTRTPADDLLRQMCLEDRMIAIRAWWVRKGLQIGGQSASDPKNKKRIIKAPKACG